MAKKSDAQSATNGNQGSLQNEIFDETIHRPDATGNASTEFIPDGIEEVATGNIDDDGFSESNTERVTDLTPFWDFKTKPVMVGVLMGQGKTIGEGVKETPTYLFRERKSRNEWLVPQWAALNDLQNEKPNEWVYRIKYFGLQQSADGTKYHSMNVEKRRKEAAE